jgi:tryptophan-rich sensory protein
MTMVTQLAGLALWVGLSFAAAACGSVFTGAGISDGWYGSLNKPSWTPPDWLFGPVWTVLYATMGVAAWLVWRREGFWPVKWPLGLFCLQLFLNAAWSALFFGLRSVAAGLAEIALLWAAILATCLAFRAVSTAAAWLMVPYLAWVTFAWALNAAIWWTNR